MLTSLISGQVLFSLHRKGIIDWNYLKELSAMLTEREAAHKASEESSDATISQDEDEGGTERQKRRRFSDTLIQQRMEEDRERVRLYISPQSSIPVTTNILHSIRDFAKIFGRSRHMLMVRIQSLIKHGMRQVI
jgi:hypothetical protein